MSKIVGRHRCLSKNFVLSAPWLSFAEILNACGYSGWGCGWAQGLPIQNVLCHFLYAENKDIWRHSNEFSICELLGIQLEQVADEVLCQVNKLDLYAHLFGISLEIIPGKEVYPGRIIMQGVLNHQISHCYHLGQPFLVFKIKGIWIYEMPMSDSSITVVRGN